VILSLHSEIIVFNLLLCLFIYLFVYLFRLFIFCQKQSLIICFNRKFHRVVTWQFSCSLVRELCHFRLSSKDGTVSATLRKQTDLFNRGPSALPLRIIDDKELTPFRDPSVIRQFVNESTAFQSLFISSEDIELRRRAAATYSKVTDPFFCLRETMLVLWTQAHENPEVVNMLIGIHLPYSFCLEIL